MDRDKLILGCAPLGGLYHRDISTERVRAVIHAAVLRHGIRNIDTAPWYGTGRSESDIGSILAQDEELRRVSGSVLLATKAGRVILPKSQVDPADKRAEFGDTCYKIVPGVNDAVVPVHDYTAAGIAAAVAGSLQRLRVGRNEHGARIAELRLHDAENDERVREAIERGGVAELFRQCAGPVLGGAKPSLGMNDPKYILQLLRAFPPAHPAGTFASVLMAGSWNLLDHSGLPVLEHCDALREQRQGVVEVYNAGIFGAGLLWGGSNFRYRAAEESEIRRRDEWAALCRDDLRGVSLPAAAFTFAMLPLAVTKVAFGCTSVQELDACVQAADESVHIDPVVMVRAALKRGLLSEGVGAKCLRWAQMRQRASKLSKL